MSEPPSTDHPRLMYIGDVPPANGFGGSLLLHRLFEPWPISALCVAAPPPDGAKGVPAQQWIPLKPVLSRLMRTRFAWVAALSDIARAEMPRFRITWAIREFRPDAIVTVLHDASWIQAWRAAQRHRLPLILIVHDDALTCFHRLPAVFGPWCNWALRKVYRAAAARFCISPEMAAEYQRRYGMPARVLYPSLARDADIAMNPSGTACARHTTCFLYAGSVDADGIKRQLAALAAVAESAQSRLAIYTPSAGMLRGDPRFQGRVVSIHDPVPPWDLPDAIRASADVLVAVVDHNISNSRYLFPTKLAEYTSYGLPILLCAPKESAAARWALGPPRRALWVEEPGTRSELAGAVASLRRDPVLGNSLGHAALDAAKTMFAHEAVSQVFREGLFEAIGRGRRSKSDSAEPSVADVTPIQTPQNPNRAFTPRCP